ncbi:hypothetical protein Patl1_04295 [Pistacia atlantica]|uniref:Uncharacterized protein n=1 Tax=Pistacia atlantica TaxID=434234 RepID=A0ACC1BX47_9ROSI|nr:hypothetical protein Patl1_04295 [Pistacia atlantica]
MLWRELPNCDVTATNITVISYYSDYLLFRHTVSTSSTVNVTVSTSQSVM